MNQPEINWVSSIKTFGLPFVNGNQFDEIFLDGDVTVSKNNSSFVSKSGKTFVTFTLNEDMLSFSSKLPMYVGPRSGIDFSFNLLDSPDDIWENQCMPHVIYTSDDQSYCYIIFYNPQGGYLTLVVDSPFAAWRIKYSKKGHKMIGFQLLNEVDDIIGTLPVTTVLSGHLFFSNNLMDAYDKICDILGITIISFQQSGSLVGNKLPVTIHGEKYATGYKIISPSKKEVSLNTLSNIFLDEGGTYTLIGKTSGRIHHTKIMAHYDWTYLLENSSEFYRKNFQDKTGAFYRAIWSDTLSPIDGVTYEGVSFGDPKKMSSCKTGEFGGFAGWMMIKKSLSNPDDLKSCISSRKYIESWALNLDNLSHPLPGTISKDPQKFSGRKYGPYHIYHDFNYPQYEIFLLEELVDYFYLTGKEVIRDIAIKIGLHFSEEHIDSHGFVWCKNKSTSVIRDYSTVHTPITGLHKLSIISQKKEREYFLDKAEKLADHICKRGLNFPTEGEQSTEDGSMACSALSLLYAYKNIVQKPEYLEMAELILNKHRVLELNGTDCRLYYSTLRFWETMYETREWGPSINGGHAWSLWTSEAKIIYAEITGCYQALREAYCGFISVISNINSNGGVYCCYTPDIIPGVPHTYDLYLEDSIQKGNFLDLFETSTKLAKSQPKNTYSTSGTYALIKSQEYWTRLAGVDFNNFTAINGVLENFSLTLAIEDNSQLFIEGIPENEIMIYVPKYTHSLTLRLNSNSINKLKIIGCNVFYLKNSIQINNINQKFSLIGY